MHMLVLLLCRLSEAILQDDKVAATAVLVFIASPASIHHCMAYTEALFTAASWLGLYCLHCRRSSSTAALAFAVSAATRSNGEGTACTARYAAWCCVALAVDSYCPM
jgi:hypothetical protein